MSLARSFKAGKAKSSTFARRVATVELMNHINRRYTASHIRGSGSWPAPSVRHPRNPTSSN
ncbi:MAG TPA: hypothetical protein VID27_20260, partial [Blastocatellia bacterium]